MEITKPEYFEQFSCIGKACEDTCCAGWGIVIDEHTLGKYKRMDGGFGNRLRNSIDPAEATFLEYDGRCAFLNEDNLCDIYIEAGEEFLCKTCREYPRHTEEFEGVREISLSLSCPEAARIMLSQKEPVKFVSTQQDGTEEYEDFDYLLYTKLEDARKWMLQVAQQREWPIELRMTFLLSFAHDMQKRIDAGALFEVDALMERYEKKDAMEKFKKQIKTKYRKSSTRRFEELQKIFGILDQLEILKPEWERLVEKNKKILYGQGESAYNEILENTVSEEYLEQLLVYFLFVYVLGAVYDEKLYNKVRFSVVSTLLIRELLLSRHWEQGMLSFEDVVDIAHRYAKEVEHSEQNIHTFERIMEHNKAYTIYELIKGIF